MGYQGTGNRVGWRGLPWVRVGEVEGSRLGAHCTLCDLAFYILASVAVRQVIDSTSLEARIDCLFSFQVCRVLFLMCEPATVYCIPSLASWQALEWCVAQLRDAERAGTTVRHIFALFRWVLNSWHAFT